MGLERLPRRQQAAIAIAGTTLALLAATLLVAFLEGPGEVPTASAVYLLAVFVSATAFGTYAGVASAVVSFVLYDFLFVQPLYTLTVSDRGEWLNLLLLLVSGILVGRLAAAQRDRARAAIEREQEALALFSVSRALAIRPSTIDVLPDIAAIMRSEAGMERVWVALRSGGADRVVADTAVGATSIPPKPTASHARLRRMPGDTPAEWVVVHQPDPSVAPGRRRPSESLAYKVAIEAAGRDFGAIWGLRPRAIGHPGRTETRLLAAAADQMGQALEQDRLAEESRDAEITRQSDRLKSALLELVSHDLRTPLASIRATAGTLMDPTLDIGADERIESAAVIDAEAEHLNRLVTNLLDLSRIEAGSSAPISTPTTSRTSSDRRSGGSGGGSVAAMSGSIWTASRPWRRIQCSSTRSSRTSSRTPASTPTRPA